MSVRGKNYYYVSLLLAGALALNFGQWRAQAGGRNAHRLSRPATLAAAANIVVNSTADGTLAALAGNATCDLREAVEAANTNAVVGQCPAGMVGLDTINFSVTGTITLTAGELTISESLTLQGPGAPALTISGNNASRVFSVNGGAVTATFNHLTIANGRVSGGTINRGGGIFNIGGTVNVTSSTLSGNSASGGGDRFNWGGGGILNYYGSVFIRNTIIAGNTADAGPDVSGPVTSNGYNLVGNTSGSSGFGATGDQLNVNPLLGPLANNGGPTLTHLPLDGSPAIDKGNRFFLTADQRGFPRPVNNLTIPPAPGGDDADIGAVERQVFAIAGTITLPTDPANNPTRAANELIEAISAANGDPAPTTINLFCGVYTLTQRGDPFNYYGFNGLPVITSLITIQGNGAVIERSTAPGTPTFRLFAVAKQDPMTGLPLAVPVILTLDQVSLRGGLAQGGRGGNSNNDSGGGGAGLGGAIYNQGTLVVRRSALTQNTAQGGAGGSFISGGAGEGGGGFGAGGGGASGGNGGPGGFGGGGGGDTGGSSAFAGGAGGSGSDAGGGGGAGLGGAVFNDAGALTLINVTLSGNAAIGGAGGAGINAARNGGPGQGLGGGVFARNGTVTINHVTLNLNTAAQGGGAIYLLGDTTVVRTGDPTTVSFNVTNSIFANSTGPNDAFVNGINGSTPSAGTNNNNLVKVNGAGSNALPGVTVTADPQLGALTTPDCQASGCRTPVHPITSSSPAFNQAGNNAAAVDQCGTTRPQGTGRDIGAFEFEAACPLITATVSGGGAIRPGQTATVTVTVTGGTAPYTITLNNSFTQSGPSPLNFTLGPQATTTYLVTSGNDNNGCPMTPAGSATITVDGTPPTIACPPNQVGVIAGTSGPVTYPDPVVNDNRTGATFNCTLASNSNFPLGVTTVNCTATDAVGNTSPACSFTVTVRQPRPALKSLIARVRALASSSLTQAQVNGLIGHLELANTRLEQGQTNQACTHLQNFINAVNTAISGRRLTTAQGQPLVDEANKIRAAVGRS